MIRFHKEGYRIILTALIISIIGVVCAEKLIEIPWLVKLIQIVILDIITLFFLYQISNTIIYQIPNRTWTDGTCSDKVYYFFELDENFCESLAGSEWIYGVV